MSDTLLRESIVRVWRKEWPFFPVASSYFREFTGNGRFVPGWMDMAIRYEFRVGQERAGQ